jgi:hypothetical protein
MLGRITLKYLRVVQTKICDKRSTHDHLEITYGQKTGFGGDGCRGFISFVPQGQASSLGVTQFLEQLVWTCWFNCCHTQSGISHWAWQGTSQSLSYICSWSHCRFPSRSRIYFTFCGIAATYFCRNMHSPRVYIALSSRNKDSLWERESRKYQWIAYVQNINLDV